jgi:hypothetical protein
MKDNHLLEFQLEMQELITEREMVMIENKQGTCVALAHLAVLADRFRDLRAKLVHLSGG